MDTVDNEVYWSQRDDMIRHLESAWAEAKDLVSHDEVLLYLSVVMCQGFLNESDIDKFRNALSHSPLLMRSPSEDPLGRMIDEATSFHPEVSQSMTWPF